MTALEKKFSDDFWWGVATASYQIEGAYDTDGRGETIWDRFSHIPGNVSNNDTGNIACDHYHRLEEDVQLMKKIGIKAYRFSIAWARIFPTGTGEVNLKGVAFYEKLIDTLIENGIKPVVTLYHWDLPQKLQDKGGWANRDTIGHFKNYTDFIFQKFGDKVSTWITHNEPFCASILGYGEGVHAPGIKDFSMALQAAHHLLLSHGEVVKAYRKTGYKGEIGIVLNLNTSYVATQTQEDIQAAARKDAVLNRWFLDSLYKGKYPEDQIAWYKQVGVVLPEIQEGDMAVIAETADFLGVNYYTSDQYVACEDEGLWPLFARAISTGRDRTDMGWEIYPEGLSQLLIRLKEEYGVKKIYIAENGAAFNDHLNPEGEVLDDDRIHYLSLHLKEVQKAIQEGVNVRGYFLWSLMDNFEWAEGYSKRFGIIHIEYNTLKRTLKKSSMWYKKVIETGDIISIQEELNNS